MTENIYINKPKMLINFLIGAALFSAITFLSLFLIIKFNFFYKFSVFKIIGLALYFWFMKKWIEIIFLSYKLSKQNTPVIQINNNGLLFNYNKKLPLIYWNQVVKIEKQPIFDGITIFFTKKTNIALCPPFTKNGITQFAAISNTKTTYEENYTMIMKHKDKFHKEAFE